MNKSPESAPRTNHGYDLYRKVFSSAILDSVQTIADIGAGDSDFAQTFMTLSPGKQVVRIDAQYDNERPVGDGWFAADARDLASVIPAETYDAVVSAFMFQHIRHDNGDAAQALTQMVGVVESGVADDYSKGSVMIYPVWQAEQLNQALKGFEDVAEVGFASERTSDRNNDYDPLLRLPTLLIHKTAALTPERLHELARLIEVSGGLNKRETPITLGRRVMMFVTGRTKRSTP